MPAKTVSWIEQAAKPSKRVFPRRVLGIAFQIASSTPPASEEREGRFGKYTLYWLGVDSGQLIGVTQTQLQRICQLHLANKKFQFVDDTTGRVSVVEA